MRTGAQFRSQLDDGRAVWIAGERVEAVPRHGAFAPIVDLLARLIDLHHDPAHRDRLTETLPSGERVPAIYRVPESADDLVRLGEISSLYATHTLGMLGRMWDPSAGYVAGLYNLRHKLAERRPLSGMVVEELYERCRREFLLTNVAFVDPPHGRLAPASERDVLEVVKSTDDGIVVSGAKTLCTGGAYSDEIIVITAAVGLEQRLPEQIVAFVVKPKWDGLKILCRDSAVPASSGWPASIRSLDEIDTCLVFEDAFIPNERVIYSGDRAAAEAAWQVIVSWDKHAFLRRIVKKFEALMGIGQKLAFALGVIGHPGVDRAVFEIGCHHALLERLVSMAELRPVPAPGGGPAVVPDTASLGLALRYAIEHYPEALRHLELIGGQALVLVPGEEDLASEEIGPLYQRYMKGPFIEAAPRAAILRLAAALVGSRLASRQRLLDFYANGGIRPLEAQIKPLLAWSSSTELIDAFMAAGGSTYGE